MRETEREREREVRERQRKRKRDKERERERERERQREKERETQIEKHRAGKIERESYLPPDVGHCIHRLGLSISCDRVTELNQ